ncbi:Gag-pol fusion protein [Phytophthora megakarya]|uniref:Gag-pol fusion protein n=1 Tax=Phytophthora megakarya TaxID=4795 RepID=A0A225VTS4_9STRA|nr:Gag-pol fusion protein [Phytophthora megakarya]
MDIASGYWNVPMAADSVEKTAFICKYGLLFSDNFSTHLISLKQFREVGFQLKMKKFKWARDQVSLLGHVITPSGILPNPEKVKAVINVKRPHDLHTARAFLGLTSYFRRFIPGYTGISDPIERFKLNGADFGWTDDCEAAFTQLKRRLIEPPILIYSHFSKRFKLYVGCAKLAVGACLMQTVDGRIKGIAYACKLLIECWGIVWATRMFRCYLDRQESDLFTDPKTLAWVFNENNRTTSAKLDG